MSSTVSIITLNISGLKRSVKKLEIVRLDQKAKCNYELSTKKAILNIETYRFKLKLHRKMYCANANEKKAGVRVRESDTIDQLSISTATAKSKKMKTKAKSL